MNTSSNNPNDKPDMVNQPPHYKSGGLEVIDVIEAFQMNFRKGNAIKYILRAGKKGSYLEDLEKAQWYLSREIEKEKKPEKKKYTGPTFDYKDAGLDGPFTANIFGAQAKEYPMPDEIYASQVKIKTIDEPDLSNKLIAANAHINQLENEKVILAKDLNTLHKKYMEEYHVLRLEIQSLNRSLTQRGNPYADDPAIKSGQPVAEGKKYNKNLVITNLSLELEKNYVIHDLFKASIRGAIAPYSNNVNEITEAIIEKLIATYADNQK